MFARAAAVVLLIVLAFAQGAGAEAAPRLYIQAAVFWTTPAERDAILEAFPTLDIMKVKPGCCFIVVTDPDQLAEIEAGGFRTEVMIEDMERFYSSRARGNNFGDLYTWSEATALLDSLHTAHPEITTAKISLGLSHENRDIWAIKISDNPGVQEDEPEVLLDALHHAREPITVNIVCDFAKYLCAGYGTDPVATFLVNERQIWIVPVVNPDGYCYNENAYPGGGGMWRKNRRINELTTCRGVDLNRNYPYMWGQGGSSNDPCDDLFMGPYAGSEPECQALMNLMNTHEFVTHDSYHSVAALVLFPWSYTLDHTPDDAVLRAMAERMAAPGGYGYGQPGEVLYTCSGGMLDWSYGEQTTKPKAYAFTTESGGSDFWPQDSEVAGLVAENTPGNIYLAQAAGAYLDVADISIADDVRGDGRLDPGESAGITVSLENLGITEGLADVHLILRSCDPYVHLSDAWSDFGSFAPMETRDNSADPFELTLDAACPNGHTTTLSFDVYAGDAFFVRESRSLTIGTFQTVFTDDFENGTGNWTFTGGTWGLVTSTYTSPTHSITDSPSGDYPNYLNSRMSLTTGLDLTACSNATLSFMHRYEIESGYDYGSVEMSVDGGPWTLVGARFTGFQTSWVEATRSLSDGCGHADVKFRFRLETDMFVTEDGWYIDDVAVAVSGGANEAPWAPALALPAEGALVASPTPELVVVNARDPNPGSMLTYGFEVYADSLLTSLVTSAAGVTEGVDSTSWTVDVTLEDGTYWWRAWADDGTEAGPCEPPRSFTVEAPTLVAGSGEASTPGARLAVEPNPFSDRTLVRFSVPQRGVVDISVFDVNGRLVRRLASEMYEAGTYRVWWDGRDGSGLAVAGGVYFCLVEAEGWRQSLKLMRVR